MKFKNLLIVLFFVLVIISLQFKKIFLFLFISLIHELSHLTACLIFKVKVKKIKILPFGFQMDIENIENQPCIKQVLIYFAGPLSFFINLIWISLFYRNNLLTSINYNFLTTINFVTFIVNLLPISPLDGFNVLKGFLQMIFPYKKALKISMIVSLMFFSLFILVNLITYQPMFTFFLLIEQIKNIITQKEKYKYFLLIKLINKKHKKYKIISNYSMYKDFNNYKIEGKEFINDYEIAKIELKSIE